MYIINGYYTKSKRLCLVDSLFFIVLDFLYWALVLFSFYIPSSKLTIETLEQGAKYVQS